jgi:hypothetical protein
VRYLRGILRRGRAGHTAATATLPRPGELLPAVEEANPPPRLVNIGDTPAEVAERLTRLFIYRNSPEWEMAISNTEKILFGLGCPRCGSDLLCRSETGFPASGPHPERLEIAR